jgi:hypothetical protein
VKRIEQTELFPPRPVPQGRDEAYPAKLAEVMEAIRRKALREIRKGRRKILPSQAQIERRARWILSFWRDK